MRKRNYVKVILHISIQCIFTFVRQLVRCCMKRLTFALHRGYAPSCDVLDTMVSIHHDVDNIVHKLFSFVIDE